MILTKLLTVHVLALCKHFLFQSKDLFSRGEFQSARTNGKIALGFNIGAVICFALTVSLTIVPIIVRMTSS